MGQYGDIIGIDQGFKQSKLGLFLGNAFAGNSIALCIREYRFKGKCSLVLDAVPH